ncbi:unnamed protein product [Rhizophagus irregularis]|nr:unnamed protein product [Rhizophagus irregularis]
MFLRKRKAGLNQRGQNQNISFRLRKQKQKHVEQVKENNNINKKNLNSNSNLDSLTQNLIPNDNWQIDISNLLSDDEMEYNDDSNFVNEENEYEDQTVDSETKQYDNSNKIHNFSGKAGPYFSNFTHFLLFMWITKHQIGCEAYWDFSNIIKHPDFNISDVPYSITTIKKYRDSLPLIPFNGYDVELNDRDTPSTSKPTRQAYVFQLKRILQRIMLNPSLRDQMYFGSVMYNLGDFITYYDRNSNTSINYGRIIGFVIYDKTKCFLIKAERILDFNSLPNLLKSHQRKNQINNTQKLWMTDENEMIELNWIESKINVWLMDTKKPDNYDYCINEIVYKSNNKWNTRSVDLRHKHPIEYTPIRKISDELPVFKFFLDIYIDKFGPFRFIPFGANCNDVLKPIIEDIKELENGFEMDLDNKRIWITGGLGNITSDLPEGNEQAGIKNYNANHGCRICTIHHDELNNMSFDLAMGGRYHHKTSLQFVELDNAQTHGEREFLSQQYGIRNKPSIFDNVTRDRHLQCPHDVFHCMGGLASNMLQETFSILTTKGEELFLTIWKCFEFPSTWSRQQSPITHLNSYFFSDYLRLTMIMPFLINHAINVNLLKDNFVNHISISYNLRRNQVVDKLCYLWVLFAKLVALVFKKTYSEAEIKNLNDLIIQWADLILKQSYELLKDQCVRNFLDNWYISPLQFDLESDSSLTCITENYINLCVQSPLKKCDLKKDDLETFLNDDLFAELGRAYEEDLNNIEHLTSRKVKYYKSISYTIVDKDEQVNVKLNVGDVVDVLEDITPLGNISQDATDMVTRPYNLD